MKLSRKRFKISIAIVIITASSLGGASIGYLNRGWKSGVVQTCWTNDVSRFKSEVPTLTLPNGAANFPTSAENDEIQNWISAAYSRERVGVEFRGFGDCVPGKPVNALMLYDADLGPKVRGLGTPGDFSTSGSTVNRITSFFTRKPIEAGVAFNQSGLRSDVLELQNLMHKALPLHLPPTSRNRPDLPQILARYDAGVDADIRRWAALHEFGHLTGLLHEERRKDAKDEQPGFCSAGAADYYQEGTSANKESRFGTDYDPFSVMNYCRKTEQVLYRQAVLVCEIGAEDIRAGFLYIRGKLPTSLDPLLANCGFILNHAFPMDLSPRDVAGLRFLYLHESPTPGPAVSYKRSETEKKWMEIFLQTDRLYL